jgi:hypothetical protein
VLCACALTPATAVASTGTYEQIDWVRSSATKFVSAELTGDGAGACAILNAPLQRESHHRTCRQRWDARLAKLLHQPGAAGRLRRDAHAIPSAKVTVQGNLASIELPVALLGAQSRFLWTDNCWMLER